MHTKGNRSSPKYKLGSVVEPWGVLQGYHSSKGERYYFFISSNGTISYLPEESVNEDANHIPSRPDSRG